jgi:hypothetical protein
MMKTTPTPRERAPGRLWSRALSFASLVGLCRRNDDTKIEKAESAPLRPPTTAAGPTTGPRAATGPAPGPRGDARPQPIVKAAPKAVRAKAPEDDDPENELAGNSPLAQARRRERARCAAILGCAAAGQNVSLARALAFNTRLQRHEAIALLESTPAPVPRGAAGRRDRDARNPSLGVDSPPLSEQSAVDASWDRAFHVVAAARGEAQHLRPLPASNTGLPRPTGAHDGLGRG